MLKCMLSLCCFTIILGYLGIGTAHAYNRRPSADYAITQIKIFTPWHDTGNILHSSIRVTQRMKGTCSNASQLNPRPDAWRCKAGIEIHDPCFANESGQQLACIKSPWDKTAVLFTLTQALPSDGHNAQNYLEQNPWGIELDTLRCVTSDNDTSPLFAGMSSRSICFNQASNVTSVKFLDSFSQEMPLWLVFIKQEDLYLEQVPIKTAWY
ncbi:MAG: hypothetical protein ACNA7Y_03750 [Gammaproteobacteria bacterium]